MADRTWMPSLPVWRSGMPRCTSTAPGSGPYSEASTLRNDWNHNAVNIEAELILSPAIGQQALERMMALNKPVKWVDPLGQVDLLTYDCSHAADLLDDFDRMLSDSRQTAQLAAQMAYWSA